MPPPDPVSRYLPGMTPAMVNRPFASTRPDADDENARATPDETSIGETFTRTRLKSAGGCWVVPSNSTRPATVMPGCSVSTTFERLRPSTETVVIAQKRSGSARGARGCAVFGGGGPGGGFCVPCAISVSWPGRDVREAEASFGGRTCAVRVDTGQRAGGVDDGDLDVLQGLPGWIDHQPFDARDGHALKLEVEARLLFAYAKRDRSRLRRRCRARVVDGRVTRRLFLFRRLRQEAVGACRELARGGLVGPRHGDHALTKGVDLAQTRVGLRGGVARGRGADYIIPGVQVEDAIDAAIVGRSRSGRLQGAVPALRHVPQHADLGVRHRLAVFVDDGPGEDASSMYLQLRVEPLPVSELNRRARTPGPGLPIKPGHGRACWRQGCSGRPAGPRTRSGPARPFRCSGSRRCRWPTA